MKLERLWIVGILILLVMVACSTQTRPYTGEWYAQAANGKKVKMNFKKEKVTIGEDEFSYEETGHGEFNNGRTFFTITDKQKEYTIAFPEKDNDIAMMLQPDDVEKEPNVGTILYAMHREEYPNFDDYIGRYLVK
ncbi:hypothetical protein [Streptococcus pluranimalium]|uniref:Uncharacterized protein n=1 Tax=Streptococcus pluranimalium TaxID=82348 RepID=A0A345VJJ7_9STRE|nr:hypothetical protein [Streptococcus pluranimalium]AXJ12899.1 hypothetical protein Sp14A_09780 [Streptococcus pluranimalium]